MLEVDNNYIFQSCPCCGSIKLKVIGPIKSRGPIKFSTNDIILTHTRRLVRCTGCSSSFTQNSIPPSEAERLYAIGDGTKRWSGADFEQEKCEDVVSAIKGLTFPKSRLCDIGCNTGEFLDFVKLLGAETHGVELSRESINVLTKNGHVVRNSLDQFKDTSFDIITAFDLIEHLYDPLAFIDKAWEKLSNNGLLIFLTGNINSYTAIYSKNKWWYASYPEHAVFPSKRFFSALPKFKMIKYIKTYASKGHEAAGNSFKHTIFSMVQKDYTGIPSLFKDHHFIVLRKLST